MTTRTVALLATLSFFGCGHTDDTSSTASPLGQACMVDADCNAGESCTAKVCTPHVGFDLGITQCATNSDCAKSEICEHGVCLPHQLFDGGVELCATDADCTTAGTSCLAGVCVPSQAIPPGLPDLGALTGLGASCMTTKDCTGGLSCSFHLCLPVSTCMADADCASGQKCQAGLCI